MPTIDVAVVSGERGLADFVALPRVLLLGTVPGGRGKAVDMLLYKEICDAARRKGYRWAEAGWVLEDNHVMRNALARMGFEPYKTYRLYERAL